MRIRFWSILVLLILLISTASAGAKPVGPVIPSLTHPLVEESESIFSLLTVTAYQHTTVMDDTTGTYLCDCSGYINTLLERSRPDAYHEIEALRERPTTKEYYAFFLTLKTRVTSRSSFTRVTDARNLYPGDIVVWRDETDGTGHVGLVLSPPTPNPSRKGELLIRIADSTLSPHADDTRTAGTTGIGSGVIGIQIDTRGNPIGMYWRGGVSGTLQAVDIAVGRLGLE